MEQVARRRWVALPAVAAVCALIATGYRMLSAVNSVDLDVYRAAGHAVLTGGNLYDGTFTGDLPFTYPPFAALLVIPVALVPWSLAQWLWCLLSLLLLAALIRMSYPAARNLVVLLVLVVGWAMTVPVSDHLGFGQIGLLLTTACVADAVARPRRLRWLPVGLLTGLAGAVKLVPAAYVGGYLAGGRWKPLCWAAIGFAGGTLLGLAVLPRQTLTFLGSVVFGLADRVALGDPTRTGNQSLRGLLLRTLPAGAVPAVWVGLSAAVMVAGFFASRRAFRRRGQLAAVVAFALAVTLVIPVSWTHHFVWIIPAVGVLGVAVAGERRPRPLALAAMVVTALVALGRVTRLGELAAEAGLSWLAFLPQNALTFATLLLILALADPRRGDRTEAVTPAAAVPDESPRRSAPPTRIPQPPAPAD